METSLGSVRLNLPEGALLLLQPGLAARGAGGHLHPADLRRSAPGHHAQV